MKIQDNGPLAVEDGVGAVNGPGGVAVVVDADISNFTHFAVHGNRIVISGRGAEDHVATYGPIVISAARKCRAIQVYNGSLTEGPVIVSQRKAA